MHPADREKIKKYLSSIIALADKCRQAVDQPEGGESIELWELLKEDVETLDDQVWQHLYTNEG